MIKLTMGPGGNILLLEDGRIADSRPAAEGKPPVVWDGTAWVTFEGTLGALMDGKPLTDKEIADLVNKGVKVINPPNQKK